MSLPDEKKLLLSQLVDGELSADEGNRVLADVFGELTHVLGDVESARQLQALLELRRAIEPWRRQEPPKTVLALSGSTFANSQTRFARRMFSLASAGILGGILVAGGFFLRGQLGNDRSTVPWAQLPAVMVAPEQRREIARAFAFHESVAGPLSWYASDDTTIQVAPAQQGDMLPPPIAVVLRLSRDASCPLHDAIGSKTYVIVCRDRDAAVQLPSSAVAKGVRVRLLPKEMDGRITLQYAIAIDGTTTGRDEAGLAGRREVSLGQAVLGQLAMDDCLLNVEASAWVVKTSL